MSDSCVHVAGERVSVDDHAPDSLQGGDTAESEHTGPCGHVRNVLGILPEGRSVCSPQDRDELVADYAGGPLSGL